MKSIQNFINNVDINEEAKKQKKIKDTEFPWFEVFEIYVQQTRAEKADMEAGLEHQRSDVPSDGYVKRPRYRNFDDAIQDAKETIDLQNQSWKKEHSVAVVEQYAKDQHRIVWLYTGEKEIDLRKELK